MNRKKLITSVILIIAGALIVILLAGLVQKLLISGTELIDGLGALLIEDDEWTGNEAESTERPSGAVIPEETESPEPTPEPEELVEIPIEQTPEELAQEYQAENSQT